MDKTRFSMLLLEPGEIYFEDYSCTVSNKSDPKSSSAKHGRLKLCSKSLVFEPKSWSFPLIKLHFKDFSEISVHLPVTDSDYDDVLHIKVSQYVEMLEDNILSPYKFKYECEDYFIYFDFASAEECLGLIEQLRRASTLHAPEHNSMVATILHSRYMRMVFDPVMMDDFSEEILFELQAEKISPLVRHQGKLALTPTTVYFQPFSNIEISRILKIKIDQIKRIFKRRFLMRHVIELKNVGFTSDEQQQDGYCTAQQVEDIQDRNTLENGIEIYGNENSQLAHLYLTFQSQEDRDLLFNSLKESPNSKMEDTHTDEIMLQWQNGIVSNYDYLVYLNCLADRSKNDLTQYPVFPWIISDYKSETLDLDNADTFRDLSKPIGALNPDRLEKLLDRYHEMSEPKFLYGSHYSAPGLVLFFLVRKYPQYMLCLQNGRFDHPDRMFNSFADAYNNCLKNMSDFKELVPEFYDTESKGDFLVNKYNIDFGHRHDGSRVGDVTLPPWATSPGDLVTKLRDALESDYVSRHLHLWIDLIFGYKQRGEEAVKANNVFHHVCYEGSVDLDCVFDMNDRHALEVQIMEFGQVPKQLFTRPHVKRITHHIPQTISNAQNDSCDRLECCMEVKLHREAVTCAVLRNNRIVSVGRDGTLKVYDKEQNKQIRSFIFSPTPLSSCVMIGDNLVAVGSWDNDIYIYDVEYGRVVESFRAHDDSVSCLLWIEKDRVLISGGWDCMVRVWGDVGRTGPTLRGLRAELDHDSQVTALCHRYRDRELDVLSGTSDGELSVWSVRSRELLIRVSIHGAPVTGLCHVSAGDRVVSAARDGTLTVFDLTVVNFVYQRQFADRITSLCWGGRGVLWLGNCAGSLHKFNMLTVSVVHEQRAHDDSITWMEANESSETLLTASDDKSVKLWRHGGAQQQS